MNYKYESQMFDEDELVEIPDDAIGVSLSTFGKLDGSGDLAVTARYLVPE